MGGLEITPGASIRVLPKIEIEIRAANPRDANSEWRVYPKDGKEQSLMLRQGRKLLGGTFLQAHHDAQRVAREMGFIYEPTPYTIGRIAREEYGLHLTSGHKPTKPGSWH